MLGFLLDRLRQRNQIDLAPSAGRTGDDFNPFLAERTRLEDLFADSDLVNRIGRKRYPDRGRRSRSAKWRRFQPRIYRPGFERAGLGDPYVERIVTSLTEEMIGPEGSIRGSRFDRDDDIVEVHLFKHSRLAQRRLDKRAGIVVAVLFEQVFRQRAGVDADPDRNTLVLSRLGNFATFQSSPMLPGLIRILSNPAAIAVRASLYWKCMSATSGFLTCCLMAASFSPASALSTDIRTMSAPTSNNWLICLTVASTSRVSVLVIDWTAIGNPPPMMTSQF